MRELNEAECRVVKQLDKDSLGLEAKEILEKSPEAEVNQTYLYWASLHYQTTGRLEEALADYLSRRQEGCC
jgi:hypothetical protein